jgi:hypothetical protein
MEKWSKGTGFFKIDGILTQGEIMSIDFRAFSYFSTPLDDEEVLSQIDKYYHSNGFWYHDVGSYYNSSEPQLGNMKKRNISLINSNHASLHFVVKNVEGSFDFPNDLNMKLFFMVLDSCYINTENPSIGKELLEIIVNGMIDLHLNYQGQLSCTGYSEEMFTDEEIISGKIENLFWFNIIGERYVNNIGKSFLLEAPGWQIKELANGNVLIRLSEHPHIYEKGKELYLHEFLGLNYCN